MKWYRKAVEQGDAKAQYNLGVMYYSGEGVLQDTVAALMWFNIASGYVSRSTKMATNSQLDISINRILSIVKGWYS